MTWETSSSKSSLQSARATSGKRQAYTRERRLVLERHLLAISSPGSGRAPGILQDMLPGGRLPSLRPPGCWGLWNSHSLGWRGVGAARCAAAPLGQGAPRRERMPK